jgi:imidazolonepropionase-like amidohydrolase
MCARLFDGVNETLAGPADILIEDGVIADLAPAVGRPASALGIDLGDRTVMPGCIDTHVHLCLDGLHLRQHILQCFAAKALAGLHLAQHYMHYGFTTVRDMETLDPDWPTINVRDAIDNGLIHGPRLIVAAHMLRATGGHGDMQGAFPCRCQRGLSQVAESPGKMRELVRAGHAFGGDWITTMNTGGSMSFGDDPATVTWCEDAMQCLAETARQLGLPVAVHTGAAEGCKQALRAGVRSLEHCYLIDGDGIAMAEHSGTCLVPTMHVTREDKVMLQAGNVPMQAAWKLRRDVDEIERAQQRIVASQAPVAYGTDCGMCPCSHGILELQVMVAAGLAPLRALKAATSVAASLVQRDDMGVLASGTQADIVAMPGDPMADIAATAKVDCVMRAGRIDRHQTWDVFQS